MPLELDECPWYDYSYTDELPVEVVQTEGPFYSDRYQVAPLSVRRYSWHLKRTTSERLAVDDFLVRARGVLFEAFYLLDPKDGFRTAVDLGVGTGAKTVFELPALPLEEGRFYPKDDADLVVRVSGSPVTVASVDTDARTITLAAPPGIGAPVEADYNGLRLCRLTAPGTWTGIGADWWEVSFEISEILTD